MSTNSVIKISDILQRRGASSGKLVGDYLLNNRDQAMVINTTKTPSKADPLKRNRSMHFKTLCSKAEKMNLADITRGLYVDDMTATWNRRAFEASDHDGPIAIVDLDSLKWINTKMGYRYGDQALIQLGELLKQVFPDDVYRLGGDEFVIEGRTKKALLDGLLQVQMMANTQILESDGYRLSNSCAFSLGIATTLAEADTLLRDDKKAREKHGWRVPWGETPPGVTKK